MGLCKLWPLALLVAIGCSGAAAPAPPADGEAMRQRDVLEAGAAADTAVSRIAIEVRDVNAIGRSVRFRGRATNDYEQPIDGVSYRLRLLSTDGSRVLRAEYREVDGEIAAGQTQPFEIELESMYFATVPRFVIDAVPRRLGGEDFTPPADWSR